MRNSGISFIFLFTRRRYFLIEIAGNFSRYKIPEGLFALIVSLGLILHQILSVDSSMGPNLVVRDLPGFEQVYQKPSRHT